MREAILSVTALAVVLGIGFMLIKAPLESGPVARDGNITTATIRLAPDRTEHCRHLMFDNRTGAFQDAGTMFCGAASEPPPQTAVGGAISGAHLGRIRDSFRAR